MSSSFGNSIKMSIFGESHGDSIGVIIDGLPAGKTIDLEELKNFIRRRAPGRNNLTTKRIESDEPKILSGLLNGVTTGFPLCAVIENMDKRSKDYKNIEDLPRPSHADYTAFIKYGGSADMRGGGHFSGRLTAPMCIAGGIAKQVLRDYNIFVGAHLYSVGNIKDTPFSQVNVNESLFRSLEEKCPATIDDAQGEKISELVEKIALEADSIGAVIECAAINVPVGLGEPIFNGVENRLSQGLFGIPGLKGVEFGSGFSSCSLKGSENNDNFILKNGKIVTESNNSGGINGGISNGMPILFKAAMKPTASIGQVQKSVNLKSLLEEDLVIKGRHDPCIALRAVPVVEAITAFSLLDMLMEEGAL